MIGDHRPADHPGNLVHAGRFAQAVNRRHGSTPTYILLDPEVGRRLRRDLRQMGDAQHLKALAKRTQSRPHDVGNASANAGINFIEDERLSRLVARGHGLEGEHYTRQFAAGHNPLNPRYSVVVFAGLGARATRECVERKWSRPGEPAEIVADPLTGTPLVLPVPSRRKDIP